MLITLATLVTIAGVVLLGLAMRRHLEALLPKVSHSRGWAVTCRLLAYPLLAIGLYLCIQAQGVGIGSTLFFGLFSAAHFIFAMLLPALPSPPASRRGRAT
ncbi:MAG: DUF3325 family protein [Pseudomonadota bacterium]